MYGLTFVANNMYNDRPTNNNNDKMIIGPTDATLIYSLLCAQTICTNIAYPWTYLMFVTFQWT